MGKFREYSGYSKTHQTFIHAIADSKDYAVALIRQLDKGITRNQCKCLGERHSDNENINKGWSFDRVPQC